MPQGLQALIALFVLLPGFISARIARSLSSQSQQSELERIIEALILSFFLYTFYILVVGTTLPIDWALTVDAAKAPHYSVVVYRWRVALLVGAAVALGVVWGAARSTDVVLRPLRKLHLTVRTNGESVWNNVFYSLDGTVQVGLEDGRIVRGWLSRYSDSGEEHSVFLEQAFWIPEEGDPVGIPGPGILVTEKAGIQYVMFLDAMTDSAKKEEDT